MTTTPTVRDLEQGAMMRLVKQLGAVVAAALPGSLAMNAVQGRAVPMLAVGLITAVLAMLAYAGAVRWSERRFPTEVAVRGAVPALVRGTALGLTMFAAVITVIAALGGYRVHGSVPADGALDGMTAVLGFMAAAAVTEELLFRGVLFRIVEERTGTWAALALSGLVFGLSHLPNPHASLWSALAIAIEAGGMLAAAYAATRSLWVPIGLHFGWNFAEGGIFGTGVSGHDGSVGLLTGDTTGSSWLSGGSFGPEASVPALVAGLVLTVLFMALARRRGHVLPRRGRRARAGALASLTA